MSSQAPTQRLAEDAGSAETFDSRGRLVLSALKRSDVLAGRYRIEKELGRGGMGAVYAAWDTLSDAPVAVKLVGGGRSEVEHARLREEVRASTLLTHRNIVRTYTMDEIDGEAFIVMERLDGDTLSARIARGALPRAEAIDVVGQLLAALEVAHAAGVVHRDVKPGNIMCCTDGRVVLMDFGLARIGDGGTATHSTSIKGTPAYMAPEVVAGRRADPRADVYAVGLILFETLTGEPPFKSRTVTALLFDQLHTALDTAGVDAAMARVIERATAKDPDARYATAAELRAAIAAPPALAPRAKPRIEDHPPQVVATRTRWPWLAAIGVLATAAVIALVTLRSPPTPPAPAPAAPTTPALESAHQDVLLFGFQQLEARVCSCTDHACGQKLLGELTPLEHRLDQTADPVTRKKLDAIGTRIGLCLMGIGVTADEIEQATARAGVPRP